MIAVSALARVMLTASVILSAPQTPAFGDLTEADKLLQPPTAIVADNKVKWDSLLNTPEFKIDLDPNSVKIVSKNDGYQVKSRLRFTFGAPIAVKGKTKLEAYYVNDVAAICNDDTLAFERSTVYSADGEALVTGKDIGTLPNPKNPKSFVTVWLALSCKSLEGKHPPRVI